MCTVRPASIARGSWRNLATICEFPHSRLSAVLGSLMTKKTPPGSKALAGVAASVDRDRLVKELIEKERAQSDTKTARLRAQRLAKEAADRDSAPVLTSKQQSKQQSRPRR